MAYLASFHLVLVQNLFWWTAMMSSIVALLCIFVITAMADVSITSRRQWGATPPKEAPSRISEPVKWVVIHHSDGNTGCSGKPCSEIVRNIQKFHMFDPTRNWNDIGYNFLVSPTGEVFEGRGWGIVGAHAPRYNSKSVGICLIGNYMHTTPPKDQLNAAQELIRTGVHRGAIKSTYRVVGHRQVRATECPGDNLYAIIQKWPRYTTKLD